MDSEAQARDNEIVEAVDNFVDLLDENAIEREAARLGIEPKELLDRIAVECEAQLNV